MGVPARVFSISLVGCAAIALAGCEASGTGGTSSSGAQASREPNAASLVSEARSSMRSASSVHVSGQLSRNGVPISVDANVTRSGDLAGTVGQHGASLQVIAASGKVYIQATPAFLREMKVPAAACATSCGKWLELTQARGRRADRRSQRSELADAADLRPGSEADLGWQHDGARAAGLAAASQRRRDRGRQLRRAALSAPVHQRQRQRRARGRDVLAVEFGAGAQAASGQPVANPERRLAAHLTGLHLPVPGMMS